MDVAGHLGNKFSGIMLYKNVWPEDSNFVERLEAAIGDSDNEWFQWQPARVGDHEEMLDYRDCWDFKVAESMLETVPAEFEDIVPLYGEVMEGVRECVKHYSGLYNLTLDYEEATNFVKYEKDQHFAIHPDHGFSYSCVVSAIGYLNDGYEGGQYRMPYQDFDFTPEAGDVILHPSAFIYAHASLPVIEGTKYSAVTMYDYNDRNHLNHQAQADPYAQAQAVGETVGQVTTISD